MTGRGRSFPSCLRGILVGRRLYTTAEGSNVLLYNLAAYTGRISTWFFEDDGTSEQVGTWRLAFHLHTLFPRTDGLPKTYCHQKLRTAVTVQALNMIKSIFRSILVDSTIRAQMTQPRSCKACKLTVPSTLDLLRSFYLKGPCEQ